MQVLRKASFLVAALVVGAAAACGATEPGMPKDPFGGAVNVNGTPDPQKTDVAGKPDTTKTGTEGKPDPSKTNISSGPAGGAVNLGGAPDLSKTNVVRGGKDGGRK
ncbi:MAG: hypothetical protein KIT84_35750 [Labilithrix sp.]|nr:hypothetical protein [Labilithrix sp.]MCW5816408.1 hypothetical protein [Labilithrix sp.]